MLRASKLPTVAHEFRRASTTVALCMAFVVGAQLFHAYSRGNDRARLAEARAVEELAHELTEAGAQFHVSAVDLINERNAGDDAAERKAEMDAAAVSLRASYRQLRALAPNAAAIRDIADEVELIENATALVESVDTSFAAPESEAVEEQMGDFMETLAFDIDRLENWSVSQRRTLAAKLEQTDRGASIFIIMCTLIAFGVGLYFYRRLFLGVFPAANHLRQVIVAMANGQLDRDLPDQQYREPQQMTVALRKLRAAAQRERHYARLDFLTDLPNRRALAKALADWPQDRPGGILIVDIDGFKLVNDGFGHPVGDELVRRIGMRLADAAPTGALVARLGGDEFAVLVPFDAPQQMAALGDQIVASCALPVDALGASLSISVSVGMAPLALEDGHNLELAEVLRPADLALYAAKANGRNGFAIYTPDMRVQADLVNLIEADLDTAIGAGDLHLAFQPIIAANAEEDEVEALVRWSHPKMGAVSPEQLIEVAERSGQMERLGHWIIDTALDALVAWPHLSISLNLSPRQLRAPNFAATLTAQCRQRGITPRRVILEITESVAVDDVDRTMLMLSLLQTVGFRVALDDFGKGYSSLWMLKQFAFDRIKIDRSLVEDIDRSAQARAVLVAAVNMGRQLGLEVVAEGIDSAAMAAELQAIGCTHLQGYWFSRPLRQDAVMGYYAGPDRKMRIAS